MSLFLWSSLYILGLSVSPYHITFSSISNHFASTMEFRCLPLLCSLNLILMTAQAAIPQQVYWERMLPNTPMPKTIIDLLNLEKIRSQDKISLYGAKKIRSQDEFPLYGAEKIRSQDEFPLYGAEKIQSQDEFPLYGAKRIRSQDELPFYGAEKIRSQDEFPLYGAKKIRSQDEFPLYGVEKIQSQDEFPLYGVEKIRSQDEFPFYSAEKIRSQDEFPLYGAEKIRSQDEFPLYGAEKIRSQDEFPFYSAEKIRSQDEFPLYGAEKIRSQDEFPLYSAEKIRSQDEFPLYGADKIRSQDEFPLYGADKIRSQDEFPFYSAEKIHSQDEFPLYGAEKIRSQDEFPLYALLPKVNLVANHHHHDNLKPDLVFFEEGLKPGMKLDGHFYKRTYTTPLLARQIAERIPFSPEKTKEILEILFVKPKPKNVEIVKKATSRCQAPTMIGEEKHCATSLESMVDFITSKLGKNIHVVSTEVEKETMSTKFLVKNGVKKLAEDKIIVCHPMNYPYVVFFCHEVLNTTAHFMPLEGEDGTRVKVVAVCHKDTSEWNPKHIFFQMLKIKPGTTPVCHMFPEGHLLWFAK